MREFESVERLRLGKPLVIPTQYDEHRFYAKPITADGVTLRLLTDTGGGTIIFSDVAEKLRLPTIEAEADGKKRPAALLPPFKVSASIPLPQTRWQGRVLVMSAERSRPFIGLEASGILGWQWFAGRVWTFDYPGQHLLLRAPTDLPTHKPQHRVTLGFKTDSSGTRVCHFPRISVIIDGESLDLLFDTGATTVLTDEALAALNDGRPARRATSFITATVFERWRQRHPNWRVIEQAEKFTGQAMIEVPSITVASYSVGPVWFTRRADKNFHEYMSQWMDRRVEGALGGSALHYFRVTVDYPNAIAIFELP